MHVALTGGTGFIGTALLKQLIDQGHTVTALVRSDAAAATVAAAGAKPEIGDLTDVGWTTERFRAADAGVHTASPGDATSADLDRAVATAAQRAYAGTGKAYVHTGGIWVWGDNADIHESDPQDPPALTAWRGEVEAIALGIEGARTSLVAPGIVHGYGRGIPAAAISTVEPTGNGALPLIGDGSQHWTTVHAEDIADLYVRVLTTPGAGGTWTGSDGTNTTVRELTEAASRGRGLGGRVEPTTVEATRERLGGPFADALLLDQRATSARARTELGWAPSAPSLLSELESGSYAQHLGR